MRVLGTLVLVATGGCGVVGSSSELGDAGDVGAERATCTTDEQCNSKQECLFAPDSGCSAVGECFERAGPSCPFAPTACGCDGTIFVERAGANPRPILSRYPCAKSITCSPTSPCPTGLTCAFTIADGCTGAGHCVLRFAGHCARPPIGLCGCDGKIVLADDADYPHPFAPVPVRSELPCADAGP